MAAGKSNAALFYSILNGKIVRQFQQPTEHTIARVNKNGKTVLEEHYDYLDGVIEKLETRDSDYGKQWILTLRDVASGMLQSLQFNYSSGYAMAFLKTIPNIDLTEKVKLMPSEKEVEGKKRTTMFVSQNGHALKWYYTKDEPNGLPKLKKLKIKGKESWDDSDILEFLEAEAKKYFAIRKTDFATHQEEEFSDTTEAPF